MLFLGTISFAALLSYGSFAAPTISIIAPTAVAIAPTNSATIVAKGSPNDYNYSNLAAAGRLNWTHSHGGKLAIIMKEDWNAAKASLSKRSNTTFHPELARCVDTAVVQNLITKYSCYGSGMIAHDADIERLAVTACAALVGAGVPKLLLYALKIWQSGDMADAQGLEGYLRYSFEILTDPAEQPSQDLCVAALNSFQDHCHKNDGGYLSDTQGSEATVGHDYKFNVDPTDDYDNA